MCVVYKLINLWCFVMELRWSKTMAFCVSLQILNFKTQGFLARKITQLITSVQQGWYFSLLIRM